jgi:hypothetical protein
MPMSIAFCKGDTMVTAGDANSLLVRIVTGSTMCKNGTAMQNVAKMPDNCNGNGCLSTAEIQTIKDWIAAGAPK